MRITFKLYASLGDYLPAGAFQNAIGIDVDPQISLNALMDLYNVPRELAHLVLVNGVFQCTADRDQPMLKEDDVVAIWPPVAGG